MKHGFRTRDAELDLAELLADLTAPSRGERSDPAPGGLAATGAGSSALLDDRDSAPSK
jgi:hypothetical protein